MALIVSAFLLMVSAFLLIVSAFLSIVRLRHAPVDLATTAVCRATRTRAKRLIAHHLLPSLLHLGRIASENEANTFT